MHRRKHRPGNLKQEREKIARYLQNFLSQVRDPERRDPGRGDNAATENATISESTRKEAIEDKKENALTADNRSVAIGLSTFDNPGPSRVQPSKKNAIRGNTKTTQEKSTQMRQNSSSQRLQGNEDVDDDYDLQDDDAQRRPKYILVGWDSFRSRLMLLLIILFILWVAIYFPLIGS